MLDLITGKNFYTYHFKIRTCVTWNPCVNPLG